MNHLDDIIRQTENGNKNFNNVFGEAKAIIDLRNYDLTKEKIDKIIKGYFMDITEPNRIKKLKEIIIVNKDDIYIYP